MSDHDDDDWKKFKDEDLAGYKAKKSQRDNRPRFTWTTMPFGVALFLTASMVWNMPPEWLKVQTHHQFQVIGAYSAMLLSLIGFLFSIHGQDSFNEPKPRFLKKFRKA
jgi:hypothetical protein